MPEGASDSRSRTSEWGCKGTPTHSEPYGKKFLRTLVTPQATSSTHSPVALMQRVGTDRPGTAPTLVLWCLRPRRASWLSKPRAPHTSVELRCRGSQRDRGVARPPARSLPIPVALTSSAAAGPGLTGGGGGGRAAPGWAGPR